ncbi:sulfurtransferase [Bryobacterales bacterium F-183]|nr:sulfurtransferase [Bryobacterales bacterium F-183]
MTVERMLRMIAGFMILLSLALATWVDQRWFWFTAFIGANLLQSAFTNWCPMMAILRKAGVRS